MHYSGHFSRPNLQQITYIKNVLKYYSRSLITNIHVKYQLLNFNNLCLFLKSTNKTRLIIKLIENLQVTENNHIYDHIIKIYDIDIKTKKEQILDIISKSLDKENYNIYIKCRRTSFTHTNIQKFIGYKFKEDKKILCMFFNLLWADLIFEIIQKGIYKRKSKFFIYENEEPLNNIELIEAVEKILFLDKRIIG